MKRKNKLQEEDNQWRKVLLEIYRDKIIVYKDYRAFEEKISPAKDCKLSHKDFDKSLSFLKEHKLAELRDDDFFYLTQKGFDVARDLQKESREIVQQFSIIFLTFVIALTSLFSFLDTSKGNENLFIWGYVISLLVGFIILLLVFRRAGK